MKYLKQLHNKYILYKKGLDIFFLPYRLCINTYWVVIIHIIIPNTPISHTFTCLQYKIIQKCLQNIICNKNGYKKIYCDTI